MDKTNMLNEEQLDNVSGGGNYASDEYLPVTHGPHLRAADLYNNKTLYIGQKMYCVMDGGAKHYAIVTLNDIKADWDIWEYVTINEIPGDFYTYDWKKCVVGGSYRLNSMYYTMYALESDYKASVWG